MGGISEYFNVILSGESHKVRTGYFFLRAGTESIGLPSSINMEDPIAEN